MWIPTQIDDQSHEKQPDDRDDLDTGEDELGFSIDGYGEDVETDHKGCDDRNPGRDVDVFSSFPVSDDDRGGRNLSTEGDCGGIPVLCDPR